MTKTILITGSTDGIGKIAALKLAKEGHTLFLHGRNKDKLDTVIADIIEETNNRNVHGYVADFADIEQVKTMAKDITKAIPHLDILVNNAGIFTTNNPVTSKGLDIRYTVNYLAPFVLTNGIKDLLRESKDARIINLSSAAQESVNLYALNGEESLSTKSAYAQSKLAILMWSFYLAFAESSIMTIALNPGSLLNTKMVQEAYGHFWSSAEKGANIIVELALSETYSIDDSGKYFDNDLGNPKGSFGQAHPDAYDDYLIEELIENTKKLLIRSKLE